MPNSAAKSVSGIVIEAGQSGQYSLLTPTAVSGLPASLSTAIPGTSTTGMRLLIGVWGHTVAGTLGVAGTAVNSGGALTENTISIPTQEKPGDIFWFTTVNAYASINASGITLGSGLTGGTVVIYGIQAAKRMLVGEVKVADKRKDYQPEAQRGTVDAVYYNAPLIDEPELEFASDYYPDDSLFLLNGGYNGTLTATSIPASPVAVLTSTSVSTGGNASASLQPTAPGMVLQIAVIGSPATAATVAVTGTNLAGETITEVVVPSTKTAATYTSSNVFASIATNGIVWGAFGAGVTITVNAVFGWSQTATTPSFGLSTFAMENYDSVGSFIAPFWLLDEWSIEGGMDKELKVGCKGPCQGVYPVGDPTSNSQQITAFSQTLDELITGWQILPYIDPISNSAGTTQFGDLIDFKITCKLNAVRKYTSAFNPPIRKMSKAYLKRRRIELDMTIDMTADSTYKSFQSEYVNGFKANKKRLVQIKILGPLMGTVTGTNYYLGSTITMPVKWINEPARDFTKESVELKLKGVAYADPALGYSHNITWYTRLPSW